jgi:hypothetical protein
LLEKTGNYLFLYPVASTVGQLVPGVGIEVINIFFQRVGPAAFHAAQFNALSTNFQRQLSFTFPAFHA